MALVARSRHLVADSESRSGTIGLSGFWEQPRVQLQDFKMAVFHLATPVT